MQFCRLGFPLTRKKVQNLAWQYAHENSIRGFSNLTQSAGWKWLKGFLRRHRQLHPKKSKNISVNWAMCANPSTVASFFDQYKKVCDQYNIELPLYIWNCDESGVQDVPKEEVVVGEKANSQVPTECGEISTVLTFTNAAGNILPPLIIHKGRRVNETWLDGIPKDVIVKASPKGYINKGIFYEYSLKWVQWLRCNDRLKKNLLLLDVHKSHIYNIAFVRLMVCNNIEVMAIPSHTSHVLQPLDSTPFVTFKTMWNTNLIEYLFTSVGCKMPKQDFWKVFWPSWRKAMPTAKLQSGFRRMGMFPINPNVIKRATLGPSAATDNVAHIEGKDMLTSWMFWIFVSDLCFGSLCLIDFLSRLCS